MSQIQKRVWIILHFQEEVEKIEFPLFGWDKKFKFSQFLLKVQDSPYAFLNLRHIYLNIPTFKTSNIVLFRQKESNIKNQNEEQYKSIKKWFTYLLFVFSRLKSILYLSPRGTRLQNVGCRTDLVVEQALASVKEEFDCRISCIFFTSANYFLTVYWVQSQKTKLFLHCIDIKKSFSLNPCS